MSESLSIAELITLIGFKLDKSSVDVIDSSTNKMVEKMDGFARKMSTFVTSSLIGLGGLAVKMYADSREAAAQVERTLQTTGNTANKTLVQLQEQASNMQRNTLVEDDAFLRDVTNRLLTFTNITGTQFDRAQQAIADVSANLDPSMKNIGQVAMQLGKALDNPTQSLVALGRMGIKFADDEKKLIEGLWKAGKQAEAQDKILASLEKRYKGSAKAAAENSTGMVQLKNAVGDLMEMFGEILYPAVRKVADILLAFSYYMKTALNPSLRETILWIAGLVAGIGPAILLFTGFHKVTVLANSALSLFGMGFLPKGVGILGTLARMPLVILGIVAAVGILVLAFNDLYTWIKGGDSLIGEFIGPWKEVGPKILAYLKPYIEVALGIWEELKKAGVNFINFIYNLFSGNKDKAAGYFADFVANAAKILWGLVVIVSNILATIIFSLSDFVIEQGPGLVWKFIVFLRDAINTMLYGIGTATWGWISGLMDQLGTYLQNKISSWMSQFTSLPSWLKKIFGIADATINVANNTLAEPSEGGGYSYYTNRKSVEDRKIRKELSVKVDANLAVPPGTPEHQISSLRTTAKEIFDVRINDLVTQLVNGTAEE